MDGIGHNLIGNLDVADLDARSGELLSAVERVPATLTSDTVGGAADFVKMLGTHARQIEERRTSTKQPYLEAGKAIDATFKRMCDPILEAKRAVETKIGVFQKKAAEEERKRREEEARRAAEEAARLEALAKTPDALEEAIQAHAEAKRAEEAAQVKTVELARTHGALGSVATIRTVWDFEVTNPDLVPRQYCVVNDTLIRAAIKANSGKLAIPGVRIFQREQTVVR